MLAGVDWAVKQGIADPERLGVGGWSYGGMLTNQLIARDRRFKAATSGAGQGNSLSGYGTDQYVIEYEAELGKPWANLKTWEKVSYPFLNAQRIVTPTLFLCGEDDWNLPVLNSEQMYQALKSIGRETQLIVYPGESHDIRRLSFVIDRMNRYLELVRQVPRRRRRGGGATLMHGVACLLGAMLLDGLRPPGVGRRRSKARTPRSHWRWRATTGATS